MKFEVGKTYAAADSSLDPITIQHRTEHTIVATNGVATWRMRIKIDDKGNEYVRDSTFPRKWLDAGIYNSAWQLD